MSLKIETRSVYHCKCSKCGHAWDSPTKPARCSACKARTWNEGEDHRFKDPYAAAKVPPEYQVEIGKEPPRMPKAKELLDLFAKTRTILDDVIRDNPCDHTHNQCFCDEKKTLANIDRVIERLRRVAGMNGHKGQPEGEKHER